MKPPAVRRRPPRGFTLVEILVVLGLLSVVMLALGAAMRTIAQTETRVDDRLQQADDLRVATNFLYTTLGRISPRRSEVTTRVGTSLFLFVGEPDTVMWVGVMPPRHGAGGRHFFRLAAENVGGGRSLVVRFLPWQGVATFPDWSTAPSRILVSGVRAVNFEYGDDAEGAPDWQPQWSVADRLPSRVRLAVGTTHGDWPVMAFPLRQLPAGDNGRGGFTLGPE
jgi:general secretion pathway protein J